MHVATTFNFSPFKDWFPHIFQGSPQRVMGKAKKNEISLKKKSYGKRKQEKRVVALEIFRYDWGQRYLLRKTNIQRRWDFFTSSVFKKYR